MTIAELAGTAIIAAIIIAGCVWIYDTFGMRPKFLNRSRNESARVGISSPIHIVIAAAIFALWLTAIVAGVMAWLK